MARPVVVIGLGQFGSRMATRLAQHGSEVVGIDRKREIVEDLRDKVTLAVALDSTDEEALRANVPRDCEVAIVGIGDDFEAILLTTVLLKQFGIKRVIARARSPLAARILTKIGADETFNPEEESADRWANRLLAPRFLTQIEYHEGHSIVEARVPSRWAGKTLAELDLRRNAKLHVVAVKQKRRLSGEAVAPGEGGVEGGRIHMPQPTEPLRDDDVLILMGRDEDLARIPQEDS